MPAYNEAPRIPLLLNRWHAVMTSLAIPHQFVIVDDGSTDGTTDHLNTFATNHDLTIIRHETNQGLGAGMRDLFQHVATHASHHDLMVTMDADNTQPPELFPEMLKTRDTSNVDVVIASRFAEGGEVKGLSTMRHIMSIGARILFRLIYPIPGVRDYTCGYRVYKTALIQRAINAYGQSFCAASGFECMADTLLQLAKINATFKEVGMPLDYTEKDGATHMRVRQTVWQTLKMMAKRRIQPPPRQANHPPE